MKSGGGTYVNFCTHHSSCGRDQFTPDAPSDVESKWEIRQILRVTSDITMDMDVHSVKHIREGNFYLLESL